MNEPGNAATRRRLELRAAAAARIRGFFAARGVIEVDTPALSPAAAPDPALDSLATRPSALGGVRHYLHTSPELAMKRLLAAGSGDIYQLCRVFRDGELGRWHQPEFLLLEWYRTGFDEHALMDEVHALLAHVLEARWPALRAERISFAAAFGDALGVDPHRHDDAFAPELEAALAARGVDVPEALSTHALVDLALAAVVAPGFARDAATFVYDYPVTQAALAAIKPTVPPVAARFEVFVGGVELGNGFRELGDPTEQRRRFERELAVRRAAGREAPPLDEAFLAALAALPPCAGVAVGVDRLIALAAGAGLADTVNFPHGP